MTGHAGFLRVLASLLFLVLLALSAGCASGPGPQASSHEDRLPAPGGAIHEVRVGNFAFSPATEVIKAGSTVTLTNDDAVTHSIIADAGDPDLFATAPLIRGAAHSVVLTKPGKYRYHCEIHPSMQGTILVEP